MEIILFIEQPRAMRTFGILLGNVGQPDSKIEFLMKNPSKLVYICFTRRLRNQTIRCTCLLVAIRIILEKKIGNITNEF